MTDNLPAAATGLPSFDRRSFLSKLIAAGVLSAGAELPAAAAAEHPDAELIELGALLDAADVRCRAYETLHEDAFDRYERPEIPEALYWRRSDFMRVCIDRNGRLTQYGDRWVYENETEITSLRKNLVAWKSADIFNGGVGTDHEAMTRIQEILAASETWRAKVKAAEDHAGITEGLANVRREECRVDELQYRIASLPAGTADGLRVKARAAFISLGDDDGWVQHEYLPKLLAGWSSADGHSERFDILATSLVVDAIKLGATAPAKTSGARAAA